MPVLCSQVCQKYVLLQLPLPSFSATAWDLRQFFPERAAAQGSLCVPLWCSQGSGGCLVMDQRINCSQKAAKMKGGIKNCGLLVLWLGGGAKRLAKYVGL